MFCICQVRIFWDVWPSTGVWPTYQGLYSEKTDSPSPSSYQLLIAPWWAVRLWAHLYSPFRDLSWIYLAWFLCMLSYLLWAHMCRDVLLYSGDTVSHSHPTPMILMVFLPPLLQWFPEPQRRGFDISDPFGAELFWWGLREAAIHGYNSKLLGLSLILCPFNRIQSNSSMFSLRDCHLSKSQVLDPIMVFKAVCIILWSRTRIQSKSGWISFFGN